MPKPQHAQHHRQHLPRHRDRDQHETRESTQRDEDKQLPDGTAGGKGQDVVADGRVAADEGHG